MKRLPLLAKDVAVNNFKEPDFPYRLTYILTYKCQFRCTMCNIWQRPAEEELSLEQIEKFFDNSGNFSWINLSGGEITLRKDLLDIFDLIFRRCRRLYLLDFPTNGFQSEEIAGIVKKVLSSYKPPKLLVTVSMDGPAELHDRIRGVDGSWEKAVETFERLRALRSRNFGVFFGMTLQPSNAGSFSQTFAAIERRIGGLKREDFHINLAQCSRHYYGNSGFTQEPDNRTLWEEMDRLARSRKRSFFDPVGILERKYERLAKVYLDKKVSPVSCQALAASFFMDPAGNVYPCSIYDRPIGNICDYGYSINRLWDTDSRRELREEIAKRECPQCWTPCEAYQSILANLLPGWGSKRLKN